MAMFVDWLAVGLLGLGALCDCRSRRIPNGLVLLTMAVATGERVMASGPVTGSMSAAVAWIVGVFPWAILWAHGWMGAGDAKYFAAGAMLVPIPAIWQASVLAALLGGVCATLLLARERWRRVGPSRLLPAGRPSQHTIPWPTATIPYALPMGLALTAVRWWSHAPA